MKALLIIDMQKDFMPGGPLQTQGGDTLYQVINPLMEAFSLVVATKDWHPKDHLSFAANHPGKKVGDTIKVDSIEQPLWPIHCVQDSPGAEFADKLDVDKIDHIFYKGTDPKIDSLSAFFDNAHLRKTGLEDFLRSHQVKEIYVVGVATDVCVLLSVLDALELGFEVKVISDGCRAINRKPDDEKKAFEKMREKGAKVILSKEVH